MMCPPDCPEHPEIGAADTRYTCPCGICIETVGNDPEVECPDCPVHGDRAKEQR